VVFLWDLAFERINDVKRDEDKRQSETDVGHDWHSHKGLHNELEGEQHVLVGSLFDKVADDFFRLLTHGPGVDAGLVLVPSWPQTRVDQSCGGCDGWG